MFLNGALNLFRSPKRAARRLAKQRETASRTPGGPPPVHMLPEEQQCFGRLLGKAGTLVEFGAGGSTLFAVNSPVARILTVESDPQWLETLRQNVSVTEAERSGRLRLTLVDIGPTGNWGRPGDPGKKDRWPAYAVAPWREIDTADLVLVDGRFRVACAAQAALHKVATIVIHDFWNRPKYRELLKILRCVERTGTLGVFTPRNNIDQRAADMFERYKYTTD